MPAQVFRSTRATRAPATAAPSLLPLSIVVVIVVLGLGNLRQFYNHHALLLCAAGSGRNCVR